MKKERECLACHVNNPTVETPMKHDESVCVNNNNNNNNNNNDNNKSLLETAKKSLTQNILNPRDNNQIEQQVDKNCKIEPSVNGIGPNKENLLDESSQKTPSEAEVITESAPAATSKNSKNRKKKKSKKKSGQVLNVENFEYI